MLAAGREIHAAAFGERLQLLHVVGLDAHGRLQTGILATQEVGGAAVREGVPVRVEERPADGDEDETVTEVALIDDLVRHRRETELLVDRLGLLEP